MLIFLCKLITFKLTLQWPSFCCKQQRNSLFYTVRKLTLHSTKDGTLVDYSLSLLGDFCLAFIDPTSYPF